MEIRNITNFHSQEPFLKILESFKLTLLKSALLFIESQINSSKSFTQQDIEIVRLVLVTEFDFIESIELLESEEFLEGNITFSFKINTTDNYQFIC